jgi:hypothetical protein
MDWLVQLGIWASGAVIVVGLMQWAKGLLPKSIPSWAYALALPIAAIGVALLPQSIFNGLGIMALAQIGYETIVQRVKKRLEQ